MMLALRVKNTIVNAIQLRIPQVDSYLENKKYESAEAAIWTLIGIARAHDVIDRVRVDLYERLNKIPVGRRA